MINQESNIPPTPNRPLTVSFHDGWVLFQGSYLPRTSIGIQDLIKPQVGPIHRSIASVQWRDHFASSLSIDQCMTSTWGLLRSCYTLSLKEPDLTKDCCHISTGSATSSLVWLDRAQRYLHGLVDDVLYSTYNNFHTDETYRVCRCFIDMACTTFFSNTTLDH